MNLKSIKWQKYGVLKKTAKTQEINFNLGNRSIPMKSRLTLKRGAKKIYKNQKKAKVTEKRGMRTLTLFKRQSWHGYCFINGHGYYFLYYIRIQEE